jgi:hypothetical protein
MEVRSSEISARSACVFSATSAAEATLARKLSAPLGSPGLGALGYERFHVVVRLVKFCAHL